MAEVEPPPSPPPPRPGASGKDRRDGLDERQIKQLALVGGLVLVAILLLVFIVENSDTVSVSFVFFDARISLIWVIVLSALIGAVAGILLWRLFRRRFFDRDR
jgi:uncharacterized integral membrane protein